MDLPWENEGMLLSEFDGFVAGLIVCPDMVPPSQWLPVVWGTQDATPFEDVKEADRVISAVMAHYNRVARVLSGDGDAYEAILDEDRRTNALIYGALQGSLQGKSAFLREWQQSVPTCRPVAATGVKHPRPAKYWPDDALQLTECLFCSGMQLTAQTQLSEEIPFSSKIHH